MEMDSALSVHEQLLARREEHRRLCASGGEDRLSALPDEMLHLVLCRLDTSSALATAALSKRWVHLPRDLPALEFKVSDVLPERYRRYVLRRLDAVKRRQPNSIKRLDVVLGRYERRCVRSLANSVTSFLDADDIGGDDAATTTCRRRVHGMTLETFPTHNSGNLNRLIATALADWGVEDLEVSVIDPAARHQASYSFPHHCFEAPAGSGSLKLKKLKLSNCPPLAVPAGPNPSPVFRSLSVLVLQGMPKTTRGRVYEDVIRACPVLEVLHLKSCGCRNRSFAIDAPGSRIRELLIELNGWILGKIDLCALPRLERLACVGSPLELRFGSVPRLACLNLSYDEDVDAKTPIFVAFGQRNLHCLGNFLTGLPELEDLVLRFTGPDMWIEPYLIKPPLGKLRRLLVADMPSTWDMTWTRILLEAAPSLETLHLQIAVVVAHSDDAGEGPARRRITWRLKEFKHRMLRQVAVGGFEGTPGQVQFVRFLRSACTELREVVLLKHGHVREKGLWDWEVAASPSQQWSEEERGAVLRKIEEGRTGATDCSTAQIVFR